MKCLIYTLGNTNIFSSFCPIGKICSQLIMAVLCDVDSPVHEENLPLAKQSKRLSVRKQEAGSCSPEGWIRACNGPGSMSNGRTFHETPGPVVNGEWCASPRE